MSRAERHQGANLACTRLSSAAPLLRTQIVFRVQSRESVLKLFSSHINHIQLSSFQVDAHDGRSCAFNSGLGTSYFKVPNSTDM